MSSNTTSQVKKRTLLRADHYDDPNYNYSKYWQGRDYEQAAEEVAIARLLKGKHFTTAVDLGGGYGRLSGLLTHYADHVVLAEPSQKQLDIAKRHLKDHPDIERKLMQADNLQLSDESIDLLIMIRVMHHLPDPSVEFSEIARVLAPNGRAIIEVANYSHARNRLKYLLKGQRLPLKPVDIRSPENQRDDEVAFVNHNPKTVSRQLEHAGLRVESVLSVSNLRNPKLKNWLSQSWLVRIEGVLQRPLAPLYFGPSVFFLVKKTSS